MESVDPNLESIGAYNGRLTLAKFVHRDSDNLLRSNRKCRSGCPPPNWEVGTEITEAHRPGLFSEPLKNNRYNGYMGSFLGPRYMAEGCTPSTAGLLLEVSLTDILMVDRVFEIEASRYIVLDSVDRDTSVYNQLKSAYERFELIPPNKLKLIGSLAKKWTDVVDILLQ